MRDYAKALDAIDSAIALQGKDSVLHHMRGMALRYQAYDQIEQNGPLTEVIRLAKLASEAFGTAQRLTPDGEHGYISEVQMLARMLDYAGKPYASGLRDFLVLPGVDPFLQGALERAEDLLEQVRRSREGEGASSYEQICRAQLDALYGRHSEALATFNTLLSRQGVFKPPVRRQIIWTYLARHNRSWGQLEQSEVARIVALLEQNLQEEPSNDKNLRLWVQAVRRVSSPPSLESVIEKVGYWKVNTNSLDATYYLYVLHSILALEGSTLAREDAMRYLEECRQMASFRRNRTNSLEWLGQGQGIHKLVHPSVSMLVWNSSKLLVWNSPARMFD
jgi:hypothetical protein